MKIVFLDAKTIGDDIDLSAYDALGEVVLAVKPVRVAANSATPASRRATQSAA